MTSVLTYVFRFFFFCLTWFMELRGGRKGWRFRVVSSKKSVEILIFRPTTKLKAFPTYRGQNETEKVSGKSKKCGSFCWKNLASTFPCSWFLTFNGQKTWNLRNRASSWNFLRNGNLKQKSRLPPPKIFVSEYCVGLVDSVLHQPTQ